MTGWLQVLTVVPGTVLISSLIILLLFAGFAVSEWMQTRRDLRSMMYEEGITFLNGLRASSSQAILAFDELEAQFEQRLFGCAWAVEFQDLAGIKKNLERLIDKWDVLQIHVLDQDCRVIIGSDPEGGSIDQKVCRDFLMSGQDSLRIGIRESEGKPLFEVAVRRRSGGMILIAADARRLETIRKFVGPGRLIQEIGRQPGVSYVVLQDTLGILMASGVNQITRIMDDRFLAGIWKNRGQNSRFLTRQANPVLEVAGVFMFQEEQMGIFRIGLEMDHYLHILGNAKIRLILIAFVLAVASLVGLAFLISTQNVRILSRSFEQVKSHTGQILENLRDGVVAVDGEGRFTVFNQAAEILYDMDSSQVVGKKWHQIEAPFVPPLKETLETGTSMEYPLQVFEIGHNKRTLSVRSSLVRGSQNEVQAAILVVTDMTRQQELEATLRQKEKLTAMGELARGVAHEIRNPINAISMIGQRLRKEFHPVKDEDEYRQLTQSMVQESRRVNTIIQQFLQFSRPAPIRPEATRVQDLLQNAVKVMESQALSSGIRLSASADTGDRIRVDRDQATQALINLLQNALDATPRGGRIVVEGRRAEDRYEIVVEDNGSGIPPDLQNRIFDLYFTTKPEGTGMGLPVVAQIIQAHGGEVSVESRPNQGTSFRLRFPLEET